MRALETQQKTALVARGGLLGKRGPGNLVLAVALVALAAVLSAAATTVFNSASSFFPFLVAVAIAALRGGAYVGVLATGLSALVAVFFFSPIATPFLSTRADQAALALFAIEALAISGLGEFARRSHLRMERNASENASLLEAERAARTLAERAIARSTGLEATAAALGRALSTSEVAEVAVRQGLARLGAGRGVAGILEQDGHTIRTLAAVGFESDIVAGWPTFDIEDEAPLSEAMRLREPLLIDTADELAERYPAFTRTAAPGGPAVVVPLLYEDRAVGGMYFRYATPAAVVEADKPYLMALGRQVAAALERARLYDAGASAWADAKQANERMAYLSQVGETLAQGQDIDTALRRIAALAVPAIADWAVMFLLEPDQTIRVLTIERDDESDVQAVRAFLTTRPPSTKDPFGAGAAIATGRVQLVGDYREALGSMDVPAEARKLVEDSGLRSIMHCPLVADERVFGALTLATVGNRTFAAGDEVFGEELGRRVGTVLANLRLNARLASRLHGQEAVARLGQLAVVLHDLDPLFEAAARELGDVLGGDITAIMQHIPRRGALRIVAGSGWREGVVGHAMIPDNAGSHSGFALVSDGPVVSMDYGNEDRFRASPIVLEHGARSGVTTPILGPDGPWGVLGVHSLTPGRFDSEQVALLDTFANVLGSAISRRSVEIAVRDRDDRLELALAASKTGFWEWNVQTGHIHWSDEICRLHGREPGTELESLDAYLDLVHEDDRETVRRNIQAALEKGAYDARFRIVLPNGELRWTHGTAKVFFDRQHRAVRMIGVARDVTEEVQAERVREQMVESERRQGELSQAFIGVVSHELRTPITSIYAGSKLLRRMGARESEKRNELTADIEAEAERLYRLTEDLLVLTRVERGTLDIGLEPVAMPRVLERVIASEQERWPLTTIELVVQPGIPIALGDNTYIEQLIRNLVGNAAKYAPQGGTVQVAVTSTQDGGPGGEEIEVRVLDRGPGLAEGDADHLFELFYRSPLTAKKAPGAGIGLFVCNHLAQAMGGRLWARNREDGGAEFGFSLRPYVADETKPAPASSADGRGRAREEQVIRASA
ncbi:MAG TPA: GAF domain-containing protein [Candidatus Limnocylindrales bacterium]|nr:GAF domain-containing protein [Candidatus Limnocylindrales bacterium]